MRKARPGSISLRVYIRRVNGDRDQFQPTRDHVGPAFSSHGTMTIAPGDRMAVRAAGVMRAIAPLSAGEMFEFERLDGQALE